LDDKMDLSHQMRFFPDIDLLSRPPGTFPLIWSFTIPGWPAAKGPS